jgi:hypothetical protein
MTEHSTKQRADWNRLFRWAALLFATAVTLHAADHLRRGMDILPPAVMIAGMVQIALAAAVVALVLLGNRWAAICEIVADVLFGLAGIGVLRSSESDVVQQD